MSEAARNKFLRAQPSCGCPEAPERHYHDCPKWNGRSAIKPRNRPAQPSAVLTLEQWWERFNKADLGDGTVRVTYGTLKDFEAAAVEAERDAKYLGDSKEYLDRQAYLFRIGDLERQLAAVQPCLTALAEYTYNGDEFIWYCDFCEASGSSDNVPNPIPHDANCPVLLARAAIAPPSSGEPR